MAWDVNNFINSLYIFFGLYFSSLLSVRSQGRCGGFTANGGTV
jgi:hypothetical protein